MQYEIEIKSLLGSKDALDKLLDTIRKRDPEMKLSSQQSQLNHYFHQGDLQKLIDHLSSHFSNDQLDTLKLMAERATSVNVRTRKRNDDVLLIVKGSLDNASAVHSHQRMEFEGIVDITIEELDEKVLAAGWQLEAKWQAERKIYSGLGLTIDTMWTPGYGYVVEFERVVTDDTSREEAHQQVVEVMRSLGVEELSNDRLERMFAYYNQHWQEYYGTDKTFVVE